MPKATTPCPRCGVELAERTSGRARLLACRDCGGVWIDRADAERIVEHAPEALEHVALAQGAASEARAGYMELDARCPIGREPLEKTTIRGVSVDTCPEHGTWFDAGEVASVAKGRPASPAPRRAREEPVYASSSSSSSSRSSSSDDSPDLVDVIFGIFDEIDSYRR